MIEKMKKFSCFFLALCIVFLLAACDSGGGSDDDDNIPVDPYPAIAVDPFLPDEFAGLTIAALYKSDLDIEEEEVSGVTYVTKELNSVYMFDDLTFVSTSTKIYINKSTGAVNDALTEKEREAKGTFTKTGSYSDGTLNISRTHEWEDDPAPGHWESDPEAKSFTVKGGVFTISESGITVKYTLSN